MRDHIFRGLTYKGEWVEGYLFRFGVGTEDEGTYILGELDHRDTIYDVWKCAERVNPDTVSQFTGLPDKNGKRIFEGDVVSIWGDPTPLTVKYAPDIDKEWGTFSYECILDNHPTYRHRLECKPKKYEVIGNIFDGILKGET